MRRATALTLLVATAIGASSGSHRAADAAETSLKIALVVPTGDPFADDVVTGVGLAVAQSNDARDAGAKRPAVEVVTTRASDSAMAALVFEKAAKDKELGVVAFA